MRKILPTALIIALTSTCVSDAQVKKSSGFFGFNRDEEQLSSGLFPTETTTQPVSQTSTAPATSAPAPPSQSSADHDGIFRGGSPAPVAPVSYVIEEGQKVDTSEKKSSFFGFGKRDKTEESDAPIVTPVPPTTPYFSTTDDPTVAKPAPAPVPQAAPAPVAMEEKEEDFVAERTEDTPEFQTDEKESKGGGFFSFFSRKKAEPEADMPVVEPTATVSQTAPATATEVVANTPTEAAGTSAGSDENIFEVPSMPRAETEPEKEKEKKTIAGTILSPVSKIRPPKKELDFTGAETIIADGEIVNDDGQSLNSRIVTTQGDGKKDPPKIVNGVKTYSSWEDVEGSSVSAADKIIKQIR
ncbi:MAG: hypothetical protein P1U86_10010 [Verrucomicrobiales bacterium]|nr:hypothetical protein [Verrucomicrobiales bacterium]